MKALRLAAGELRLDPAYPDPEPAPGTAIVSVRRAGVCSTDLQLVAGYMQFEGVLGHELLGDVLSGPPELVGRRVVAEINFACGACAWCGRGLGRHCPSRTVMGILRADGCFAERVRVPAACLHLVPDGVTDEEAVFAEPLAAAFEVLEQVHVEPGLRALVLGDGKLGLLCAQVLALAGAGVTVAGRHARKLELARRLGLTAVTPDEARAAAAEVDLVVEATGSKAGLELAAAAVRPRGTIVLKSTLKDAHALWLAPLVIHEVTVVGSRCGPFAPALRALAARRVAVTPLVDAVYPLGDGPDALAHAARPGTLKVLLAPGA